jgi:LEA14-like dessication related protein
MRIAPTASGNVPEARARASPTPRVRLVALALGLMLMCACRSMLPKLEAPRLTVVAIHLGPTDNMQQQQIRLRLHAANPNDRAIPIRSIDCKLELESAPFAEGRSAAAFVLPANGETDFDVDVVANLNSALIALVGSLGHSTIGYRVHGEVHLQGSLLRSIPFDGKGRVKL